jgi:hypothetical protein
MPFHSRTTWRLITAPLLAAMVVTSLPAQSPPALRMTTIATYGTADGPGELGAVSGVVEGRDGQVLILDGANKKVAVFARGGALVRTFGAEGEGPGEFRQPTRMSRGPSGSIYVWDPQLKRVSQFSEDGKSLMQRQLPMAPSGTDFTVVGNHAWLVRLALRPGMAVRSFDLATGVAVDSFAPLSDREVSISGFGAPGSITHTAAGDVIYAGPFPVDLRTWSRGTVRSSGSNRFPDARGITSAEGVRNAPVSMRGVAARPDGTIAALYTTSDITPEKISAPLRYWLEILSATGTSLGKVELTGVERAGSIAAAANGDLLIGVVAEIPQVRRVRVR